MNGGQVSMLVAIGLLTGCSGGGKPEDAPQAQAVPVLVATADQKDVPVQVRTIGSVESFSSISIRSQVGGVLKEVGFQEGESVFKGQVLFTIDARPFETALALARASLARDRASGENAVANVARYEELAAKGEDYVTKQVLDQVRSSAESAKQTVLGDEAAVRMAELELDYCTITAPISGHTGALLVHPGNVVKANDENPLVVLLQTRPVHVSFTVPERDLPEIRSAAAGGALEVAVRVPTARGEPRIGRLSFLDNSVNGSTGTIRLKATFPNEDEGLWPGQFVDVVLTLGIQPRVVVVPSQAVQTGQQGRFVFVVKPDGTVESRPVTVSRTFQDVTIVDKGIAAGETVVTDGQLRLQPGVKVEVKSPESTGAGGAS